MPRAALRRRFAARSRMLGMLPCKSPRDAGEIRRGDLGADMPLLALFIVFHGCFGVVDEAAHDFVNQL